MNHNKFIPSVSHSDMPEPFGKTIRKVWSVEHAVGMIGAGPRAVELGMQIFEVTAADRARREANNSKSAEAVGNVLSRASHMNNRMGIVASQHDYLMAVLEKERRGELSSKQHAMLANAKGLGHELGHVQQYGSFTAARVLDQEIRALRKYSDANGSPFLRVEEFENPEHPGITYDFRGVADPTHPDRLLAVAQRNRPAADIETKFGTTQLFRKSIFLVHHPDAYALIDGADGHDTELPQTPEMRRQCQYIGEQIVGSALRTRNFTAPGQQVPTVIPISSTYIELQRHH